MPALLQHTKMPFNAKYSKDATCAFNNILFPIFHKYALWTFITP